MVIKGFGGRDISTRVHSPKRDAGETWKFNAGRVN